MTMEFRVWITVTGLPFAHEDLWEPVINRLEHDHSELGPVIGWDDEHRARFVVSLDADDFAHAASVAEAAISDALRAASDAHVLTIEASATNERDLVHA